MMERILRYGMVGGALDAFIGVLLLRMVRLD